MAQKTIADFEPLAWWNARKEIGRGLREYFVSTDDLPPQLLLLVKKLDKSDNDPQSSWIAK
jgi:hypothetical protein